MEITNVNLRFVRKAKGVAPLSPFAVQNDGSFVVVVPDAHEVRTFHVANYDVSGKTRGRETFSVETLRKTLVAGGDATGYIGITDDDLYVFQNGRKGRFLPDRRASYTDAALGADGKRFGTAFCDMLASGYSVALGEATSGRLLWAKDVAFPVQSVAVSPLGDFLAVGGETGEFLLLDTSRTTLCRFLDEAARPIVCLATTGAEGTVIGTENGVSKISPSGERLWNAPLVGQPVQIALSENGAVVAVLLQLDETSGRLVFLSGDHGGGGEPLWDIDFDESRPTGVSLSPSGQFCAVSLRDGSLFLYEAEYGDAPGGGISNTGLNAAETLLTDVDVLQNAGNWEEAFGLLRVRLEAVPSDAEAGRLLSQILHAWGAACLARAADAEQEGDFVGADAAFVACLAYDPLNAEAALRRRNVRRTWAKTRKADGLGAMEQENWEAASHYLRESLRADETQTDVRERLGDAERAASQSALQTAKALIKEGAFGDALLVLSELQKRKLSGPEITQLLRDARTGEAFALGVALYGDRQYPAALFQFKKVLRLQPNHRDALQKVAYIQNFLSDTQISDRFGRLE